MSLGILKRCTICNRFHASYLVPAVPGVIGGNYCYDCWMALQAKNKLSTQPAQEQEEPMDQKISPPEPQFSPGMKIRVLEGPFEEFRGVVQEVDPGQHTATILVNFFGKMIPAELDFSQMKPER